MTTFAVLLDRLLRDNPGRPFVTHYDDATGERTELSVTTYANWVAKTSSLFVDELDLERGGRLLVDLPAHWLAPVFVGAAWNVGLTVVSDEDADLTVCGPDGLERHAGRPPVLATALHPLGLRFGEPLPDGVHDFGVEVWSQPDAFLPYDPATGDDEALPGVPQAELFGRAPAQSGARLLTDHGPVADPGTLVDALTGRGSLVYLVHATSPEVVRKRYADEGATATTFELGS